MAISPEQVGVVVAMDKSIAAGLARVATRRHWWVIHLPTAAAVRQALGRKRVDIVVVQIAVEPDEAVELIRWLRATRERLLVIAVSAGGGGEIEHLVRRAGVQCYLPATDEEALERVIVELLGNATDPATSGTSAAWGRSRYAELPDCRSRALSRPPQRNLFPSKTGLRGPASDRADHEPSC